MASQSSRNVAGSHDDELLIVLYNVPLIFYGIYPEVSSTCDKPIPSLWDALSRKASFDKRTWSWLQQIRIQYAFRLGIPLVTGADASEDTPDVLSIIVLSGIGRWPLKDLAYIPCKEDHTAE